MALLSGAAPYPREISQHLSAAKVDPQRLIVVRPACGRNALRGWSFGGTSTFVATVGRRAIGWRYSLRGMSPRSARHVASGSLVASAGRIDARAAPGYVPSWRSRHRASACEVASGVVPRRRATLLP